MSNALEVRFDDAMMKLYQRARRVRLSQAFGAMRGWPREFSALAACRWTRPPRRELYGFVNLVVDADLKSGDRQPFDRGG
jgi:hypothetical protein